ncbi:hypothetical protein C8R32_1127 [Nitrosospira sp. Nsp5]|uniref:Morphogenetic protein n=1 Tax=Nitrosospira multiformis TaxID=1231 RepID=A0ABY0TDC6_9PROT|nr:MULTISPECIES: hypothetical protein [Nitrosospira]PTR06161.1 hypothetical protein C8R32_1127 [Nitrosospira sp. Nsp5]SDQ65873.1 hypothetical protein SAMN05216402_1734 [Nitrosospira multiformis]
MKETPLLFKPEMVRALLEGRKSQTRRTVKPRKDRDFGCVLSPSELVGEVNAGYHRNCPYGQPGDRIWCKETFWARGRWETRFSAKKGRDEWHFVDLSREMSGYRYEEPNVLPGKKRSRAYSFWWKRPSLFMPRHASRILLEITAVRVERLQDISEEDARAEGVLISDEWTGCADDLDGSYIKAYRFLWETINGAGSWDVNPYVWGISFRRI